MASRPLKLDGIKIQTARMLEIYALLRRDLEKNTHLGLSAEDLEKINQAVATVECNMRQLQAFIIAYQEETSSLDPEVRELEEILDSVLKWVQEEGE